MTKSLKDIVKKNPEPAKGKNSDPGQLGQYSAKHNISEDTALEKYLSSKGINPQFVSKDTKIAHSKSNEFLKWKRDHMVEDITTQHKSKPGQDHVTDLSISPTRRRLVTLKKAKAHYEIPSPPGTMRKEETITELKKSTVSSYMQKAKQQSKEAEPHTKGEYGSIVQRLIDRRKKGMAMATKKEGNQMSSLTPESIQIDEVSENDPWKQKHFGPTKVIKQKYHVKTDTKSYNVIADTEKHAHELVSQHAPGSKIVSVTNKGRMMEEVELDEVSSELLGRYKEKAKKSADELSAAGKHKQSTDRWMNVMKATGKQIDKTTAATKKALNKEEVSQDKINQFHKKLDKLVHHTFGKSSDEKKMKEDVGDAKAAVNADGLPNPQLEPVSEKKKQMSKSARMIKAIYKHHRVVKEDMHDHEKEDKSVQTYGKKPKFEKAEKDEGGEKKPSAAAVVTGGTTLTGNKRDDIEIDPMMRNRPGQPDVTKKDDKKKDDKKKDEKK